MTDISLPAINETRALGATTKLTDFRSIARMGYIAILVSFGGFGLYKGAVAGRGRYTGLVDGREAVGFLKKVKEYIEEPEELLLEG